MEKLVQLITVSIVKWTPIGVGFALTLNAILNERWAQAASMFFVTMFSSLWIQFSGKFLEEASKEAEERGGGLAKWIFAVYDRFFAVVSQNLEYLVSGFEYKYYQRLIYMVRNYETQGLDKERILTLQNLFVPLRISQKSLAKISPDLIQELPEQGSKNYGIGELLVLMSQAPNFRRLAILGAPGVGKTTLLRYLTFVYASRQQRKLLHPKAPQYIPVLMYLREVRKDIVENPNLSLVELINRWVQQLQISDPLKPPPGWFSRKLHQNQCLILLDGLDEITNKDERQQDRKSVV